MKSDNDHLEINVSETSSENVDEILELDASHLNEEMKKYFTARGACKSNTTMNSSRINISTKVNINIKLSMVSSSTTNSDTDTSAEIDDSKHSEVLSKNDNSISTETATQLTSNSYHVAQCKQACIDTCQSNKNFIVLPNHVKNYPTDNEKASITKPSLIYSEQDAAEIIEAVERSVSDILEKIDTRTHKSSDTRVDGSPTSTTKIAVNDLSISAVNTSEEIDENAEQLLNEVYGDTWRTPQLVKKCVSTKKKPFTDVGQRNRSRGFSLFRRDILSELDSTRITPVSSDGQANESVGDHSSRILRTCHKVPANRILNYSSDEKESDVDKSDDESDVDESGTDDSFKPTAASSEESNSSSEKIVKPKRTSRKNNKLIYLDLTCQEVIEDEDHMSPNATAEDLEEISKKFLESLQNEVYVQTPAPTKANVPVTVTKRKRFSHNYEDQPPFEEVKTPTKSPVETNDKIVQLKTPIPTYLIPPKYRDRQLTTADGKKVSTQSTPVSKRISGFLESLDDKEIPDEYCDPDALKFRNKFKQNRSELVKRLMKIYNEHVFGNKLKDIPVLWSKTLRKTAGLCYTRKIAGVRVCNKVELSEKVTTTADRVRDTLIHELCHAAAWVFDGEISHGKVFKMWAEKCIRILPELPKITRCHDYDIDYKFTYKCTVCGLRSQCHSKPKKEAICAKCHGPIEVFLNQKDKDGKVNLVKPKEVTGFSKFVQENYKIFKEPGRAHVNVMKILSNNFAELTVQEKLKYKK